VIDAYPRSGRYDLEWMMAGSMGPNALWLAEALSQVLELRPGMRVLDLGCGKALSSVFLAREFGVQVWATDLWIAASENWQRIREAGVEDLVFPIHAEAHALPFAAGFFDAAVSLDAYHYFGTDDLYLGAFAALVRPGGQLGIVVPGLARELTDGVPEPLRPHWEWEFASFHSPCWWRHHWQRTGLVEVQVADRLPEGWGHWLRWERLLDEAWQARGQAPPHPSSVPLLEADGGELLGFTRVVARRTVA
jgi:SAM-dependent methyltransferase